MKKFVNVKQKPQFKGAFSKLPNACGWGCIVGVINIGYGNPPKEVEQLKELAETFNIDLKRLSERTNSYYPRPQSLVNLAKKRLRSAAKLIGEIVEKAQIAKTLKAQEERLQLLTGKPSFEIADILRGYIGQYRDAFPLLPVHYKIVHNILSCRTAELGGHIEKCNHCGTERISYNSCRNRHCPKCQSMPREKWLDARKAKLLPVNYYHNVFTLPHDLNPIILSNKRIMLNILFKAVSQTLLDFGQNQKNRLGGKLGFIAVLHTWDQQLNAHFHLHCLIPGGVFKTDDSWQSIKNAYLFNVKALSKAFRGKFLDYMTKAYQNGALKFKGTSAPFESSEQFDQLTKSLYSKKWVVYIQKPIKNPEYVLEYLGRYTHRVAISKHRIVSVKDGKVTFKYKNRKTNQAMFCTITAIEFIRRFLLHALPIGFMRIRHFGFLSNRHKTENIQKIKSFLGQSTGPDKDVKQSIEEIMLKLSFRYQVLMSPIYKNWWGGDDPTQYPARDVLLF